MDESFDAVILGTGHNALVLGAYLTRCGLSVLVLDRAPTPGGGLATVENPRLPGFRHNTHAFFLRGITDAPWFADLRLADRGVRLLQPDPNVAMLLPDGQTLQWWSDPARTADSFAALSPGDGAELRRWVEEFAPIVERILIPEAQSPPLPPDRRRQLLSQSRLGRRLLEVSAMSPVQFVRRHFRHAAVQAGLLFFNGLREVDLRLAGFGHAIPAILAGRRLAQMCVGGSAELARGLVEDLAAHGGRVRCGVTIRRIVVRGGQAAGVELADGTRIAATGLVASGLNPQQTFLELMDERDAPVELRRRAEGFQYNLLAPLFALNVALKAPPAYEAARRSPELTRPFMVLLGLERMEQFEQIVAAHETGSIPPTVMWGACPTQFDPGQAPPGRHVAFMWEKLPYRLAGDPANWDAARDGHARRMLEHWRRFAPNMTDDNVLDWFARSPLDTERDLPNMRFGDLLVGAFANGQVGFDRPFPGAGCYRTPIGGLYLCGGSTHPGGNITGLCGYNAASVVAADLALPRWWSPPDIESTLRSLAE